MCKRMVKSLLVCLCAVMSHHVTNLLADEPTAALDMFYDVFIKQKLLGEWLL